jgi:hypothetical protein
LFATLSGAEVLERKVRDGVSRWYRRRFAARAPAGALEHAIEFLRQVLTTTTLNLVSSRSVSRTQAPQIDLPTEFFLDVDGLAAAIEGLGADVADVLPATPLRVSRVNYSHALRELSIGVVDYDGTRIDGDTHFAFLVPERAFEDLAALRILIDREALSPRLALCWLMTDFPNPVFSAVRESLLRWVPDVIALGNQGRALDDTFANASSGGDAPALPREFSELWSHGALIDEVKVRLAGYWSALQAQLQTATGALDILRLAESRKAEFRERPLAEFSSTLSVSNPPPAVRLSMRADGTVVSQL